MPDRNWRDRDDLDLTGEDVLARLLLGDVEHWRPTGLIQGAGLYPRTLVDAVREEVDRRDPWRSRGWHEAVVPHADEPLSFTVMDIPVRSDPRVADDRIEFRDPTTGHLRATLTERVTADGRAWVYGEEC